MNSEVDLTNRADPALLLEWMDEPCSYEDFRQCLVDLGQVNRLTLAARPTLDFLERLVGAGGAASHVSRARRGALGSEVRRRPLRIVDVGFGGGDMLRRIEHWARRRGIAVQLTGIDLNPYAARAAAEFTARLAPGSRIEWITGDAFSYTEPCDVVLSALFTHHLPTAEVVRFLAWSEAIAARGWFVNDLCREATPYRLFTPLARMMRWHRFVQHDGPVSFRRAFRELDWNAMAAEAGIASEDYWLQRWTPGRLCVGRLK